MKKNTANQQIVIFAYDTVADTPKDGDADNIIAYLSKDGAASVATNDLHPTEMDAAKQPGLYSFDMLQEESNADLLALSAMSSTANIFIEPVAIYTINDLSLGDIQGEIQSGVLAKKIVITGDPFTVVEGNVKTFVITLGAEWDLTGKFVYFVMSKIKSSDAPIVNRLVDTITDAVNGVAEIDLLSTETTPEGCYEYQVEIRNDPADDEPETAMEGTAEITENLRS